MLLHHLLGSPRTHRCHVRYRTLEAILLRTKISQELIHALRVCNVFKDGTMWRLLAILFIPSLVAATFWQQSIAPTQGAMQRNHAPYLICSRRRAESTASWIAKIQAAQCNWNNGRRQPFVADATDDAIKRQSETEPPGITNG